MELIHRLLDLVELLRNHERGDVAAAKKLPGKIVIEEVFLSFKHRVKMRLDYPVFLKAQAGKTTKLRLELMRMRLYLLLCILAEDLCIPDIIFKPCRRDHVDHLLCCWRGKRRILFNISRAHVQWSVAGQTI